MAFNLPPEIHEKMKKIREYTSDRRAEFGCLSNSELAVSAKFWMQQCRQPKEVEPDEPVYDSTFWHIIVPEMIYRLEQKDESY